MEENEVHADKSTAGTLVVNSTPAGEMDSLAILKELDMDLTHGRQNPRPCLSSISSNITRLDLSGRRLSELPVCISELMLLQNLDVSDNQLVNLPVCLEKLQHLQQLLARNNRLENFRPNSIISGVDKVAVDSELSCIYTNDELEPAKLLEAELDVSNLPFLRHVDLSGNLLSKFPYSLPKAKSIIKLNLSKNKLSCLPEHFKSFPVINHLFLENNYFPHLYEFPPWLFHIKRCSVLSFQSSYLASLVEGIPCDFGSVCRQIVKLDLQSTGIKEFPLGFTGLLDLEVLQLGNLPRPQCAEKIFLGDNDIWSLPREFCNLVGLVHFSASHIQLSKLPEGIGSLVNLVFLDLSHNNLNWLPEDIQKLVNLQTLDVSANFLQHLPLGMKNLVKLTTLNISFNEVCYLPEEGMDGLHTLDAYSNRISCLPDQFSMENLTALDLSGNLISRQTLVQSQGVGILDKYSKLESNLRRLEYTSTQARQDMPDAVEQINEDLNENLSEDNFLDYEDGERDSQDIVVEESVVQLNSTQDSEDWDLYTVSPTINYNKPGVPDPLPSVLSQTIFCPADDHKVSYINTKRRRGVEQGEIQAFEDPEQFVDVSDQEDS